MTLISNLDAWNSRLKLRSTFQAMDGHWVHRQTFASLVYRVHATAALPLALINQCLLPPLLRLAEDKVIFIL